MKTRTITVREGELLGPVDFDHPSFAEITTSPERYHHEHVKLFREMCEGVARGETWEATTDSGWPKIGWGKVLEVGMWDGWPYWKPMPSFLLASHLGAGWHSWYVLADARKAGA